MCTDAHGAKKCTAEAKPTTIKPVPLMLCKELERGMPNFTELFWKLQSGNNQDFLMPMPTPGGQSQLYEVDSRQ